MHFLVRIAFLDLHQVVANSLRRDEVWFPSHAEQRAVDETVDSLALLTAQRVRQSLDLTPVL